MVEGDQRMIAVVAPTGEAPPLNDGTMAAHLSAIPGGRRCAAGLRASAIWAARLPAVLAVYPRGATQMAAGSGRDGCRARVVGFTTPVPVDEVISFYWTRARAGRLSPEHRMSGDSHVLSGAGGGLAFDLRAERRGDETVVRLATLQR